ncbi:syntaxin-17-like [Haliotis asinina]|uniref:syntaxin-17-like n=1 Tax=Haliotis asinina TaxID=109174 RepID=UPI003531F261
MSFEKPPMQAVSHPVQKYEIKRLEPSVSKFLKVLEIDLDRLQRHKLNMEKLLSQENWKGLDKEQVNASRTIQQIKANIREIEKARRQVREEDLAKFDDKVECMKEKAVQSIEAFVAETLPTNSDSFRSSPATPECPSTDMNSTSLPSSLSNHQVQLHSIPDNTEAAASWENLQENLVELNEMIHEFASMVDHQGDQLDHIEDNIDKAQHDVNTGALSLGKAAKYKAAVIPVVGAVIGGVVAGPLGAIAMAKVGALAGAAAGGVVGYIGGNMIKKRQDNITEVEMNNLSQKSSSLSDSSSKEETSAQGSMMPWNWASSKPKEDGANKDTASVQLLQDPCRE